MAAPRGLSVDDIETLRSAVSSGRRPKVVFTAAAGQIAGQTGQVTAVGDPAGADEFISVRFGRDKLEFAPGDLQLPGKAPRRPAKPAGKPAAATPAPASDASRPAAASTAKPAATATVTTPQPAAPAAKPAADTEPRPAAARPAARRGKAKGPAELSVTLTWQDGDWSVQAQRGSRVLAKPTPVRAADALRMVEMLDAPAVSDAVGEIVAAARDAAAERAEQLRRELAEVEARLAELPQID
ncbi:hypothetical protein [Actinocatenispora sera]|uniref:Translation initiation factor n=1 Tax=Actinocatenispora sera TaxID=390989 RepID=A0A810L5Z3_9ACTN|nr:hypothetical protein [Actinocatenispora sera]BCJ30509.1 hypothetical protein Asera_46170 [Actinocatenispora sera]